MAHITGNGRKEIDMTQDSTEGGRRSGRKRRPGGRPGRPSDSGLPQDDPGLEASAGHDDEDARGEESEGGGRAEGDGPGGRMNLKELKEKKISELTRMARDLGIEGAAGLRGRRPTTDQRLLLTSSWYISSAVVMILEFAENPR